MIDCPSCCCEMRVCVERGIELDICDSCNGVWLDAGELTKLAKDEEKCLEFWKAPTNLECKRTTLHCSRCPDTLLVEFVIDGHDFQCCCICDGLFIDSGTLDNITSPDSEDGRKSTMDSFGNGVRVGIVEALLALHI